MKRKRAPGYTAPPETAVLTPAQLAGWFQVSPRQIERLQGVPHFSVGGSRSRRYLVRDVLRWLQEEARQGAMR